MHLLMKKINNNLGIYIKNSHMWGCLFLDFLRKESIPFKIINEPSYEELRDVKLLVVPGGFASERAKGLGKKGFDTIREYVKNGGIYFGVCGGAGLCLDHGEYTLGICGLKRKRMEHRVPNFSGHLQVTLTGDFLTNFGSLPDIGKKIAVPVWWPSQFHWNENSDVKRLAIYHKPMEDLWIADIPFYVLKEMHIQEVEKLYGINLDFSYIKHEPCILMGGFGKGKYFLTYPHLETPGSNDANRLLVHVLSTFLKKDFSAKGIEGINLLSPKISWDDEVLLFIFHGLHELISKAQENFLLCWRKKWLLGWRRGVIGLSLNSLLYVISFLLENNPSNSCKSLWSEKRDECKSLFFRFKQEFEKYIVIQREYYLKNPHRAPDRFGGDPIHNQIVKLTGPFPGDGGLFKEISCLLERVTSVLFDD